MSTLTEILSVVQSQKSEIMELRHQLNEEHTHSRQQVATLVHEEVHALQEAVISRMNKSLAEYSKEESILFVQANTPRLHPCARLKA